MDQFDTPELGSALIRWVNALGLSQKVSSWRDLRDGGIFWEILTTVEPDYFSGKLPEPLSSSSDNWIPRWQNLKFVNRHVTSYICEELKELPALFKRMDPDLKAIAIDSAPSPTMQILKAILLAAMFSPISNPHMVTVMNKMNPKDGMQIAECITQMQALDQKYSEAEERPVASPDLSATPQAELPPLSPTRDKSGRDPELEREEKLIHAYARIQDLEKKNEALNADLRKHLEDLREMQDELTEARYKLEHKGLSDADSEVLEELRQRSNRDNNYIAELESELTHYRDSAESLERQLGRLQDETSSKQKLRDDLQLLRVERDELLQKAKASDNLRKKIQSLQDSEKSTLNLRADFAAAQEDLKTLQKFKDRCTALQKANEENMKLIQNGEQEIFDQKTTRKRLDYEMKSLQQRLRAAEEKSQKDQETIHEQEERIRDLESGDGDPLADSSTLDEELVSGNKSQNELRARLAELEAQLSRARDGGSDVAEEDTDLVQQKQQMLQARADKMEKQYLDLYQENLGLEASLKDVETQSTNSRPFLELRDRLKVEEDRYTASEKRLFDIESELSGAKYRLQSAESKLSAVDQSKADALKTMQDSASSENKILEVENSRLLGHIRDYQTQLEEQKSLLRHSLLDKGGLQQEEASLRSKNEFLWVKEQLKALREKVKGEDDTAVRLTKRIEDAREGSMPNGPTTAEAEAYKAQIQDLQTRLQAAEAAAATMPKETKGITPLETNIQRELKLMATAWYDMASRMQSDAVVIQRRSEGPKSFLGQQRRLLNSPRPQV